MTKKLKRRTSVAIVLFTVLISIILGGAPFLPTVFDQVGAFSESLPSFSNHLLAQFTPGTMIHKGLRKALDGPAWADLDTWLSRFLTLGGIAFSGGT